MSTRCPRARRRRPSRRYRAAGSRSPRPRRSPPRPRSAAGRARDTWPWPRPRRRRPRCRGRASSAAATRCASVTLAISSARARSSPRLGRGLRHVRSSLPARDLWPACRGTLLTHSISQFLDTDHLRLRIDMAVALDAGERLADGGFGGLVRDQDHGRRRSLVPPAIPGSSARRAAARCSRARSPARPCGPRSPPWRPGGRRPRGGRSRRPGARASGALVGLEVLRRHAEGRHDVPRAMSRMSLTTADAVGRRRRRARSAAGRRRSRRRWRRSW